MKYEEPNMMILEIQDDIVTASNTILTDGGTGGTDGTSWSDWF